MFVRAFRHPPSLSLVVSMLALFVALGGLGYAATGGSLILGRQNSTVGTTRLSSNSKRGPSLAVKNTGGQPAASFSVRSGVAPFSVGSATKVARLNADLLDGLGSSSFWSLGGNAGTNSGSDFLGTKDAKPLVVKTNNTEALRVNADGTVSVDNTLTAGTASSSGIALSGRASGRAIVGNLGPSVCPRGPAFAVPAGRQRAWRLATLPPCQARLGAESAPCHPSCRQPCHPAGTSGRRTLRAHARASNRGARPRPCTGGAPSPAPREFGFRVSAAGRESRRPGTPSCGS